jgi:hypothetical protein
MIKILKIIFSFVNSSVEELTKDCLGFAEDVYEHVLVNDF